MLIINMLSCHLSFITFAFTLSLLQFAPYLWLDFLRDGGVLEIVKFGQKNKGTTMI